jgi:hypothetical protein
VHSAGWNSRFLLHFCAANKKSVRYWSVIRWRQAEKKSESERERAPLTAASEREHTQPFLSFSFSPFSSAFHQNWCQIVVTHASLEQSTRWILLTAKSSALKIAQNHSRLTRQPYRSTALARLLSNPTTKFFAIRDTPTRNNKIRYCLSAEYSSKRLILGRRLRNATHACASLLHLIKSLMALMSVEALETFKKHLVLL